MTDWVPIRFETGRFVQVAVETPTGMRREDLPWQFFAWSDESRPVSTPTGWRAEVRTWAWAFDPWHLTLYIHEASRPEYEAWRDRIIETGVSGWCADVQAGTPGKACLAQQGLSSTWCWLEAGHKDPVHRSRSGETWPANQRCSTCGHWDGGHACTCASPDLTLSQRRALGREP